MNFSKGFGSSGSSGEIVITISPDGEPTIEVNNVTGKSCKDLTASLENMFGSVETERIKPEYHEQKKTAQGTNVRLRG